MINYVILAMGTAVILAAATLIFLDKVKGEDIYFSMDVKEQEIKKVIEDADEIISELNYTSEMVVHEIEEKMNSFREELKKVNNTAVTIPAAEKKGIPAISPVMSINKKKKITNDDSENSKTPDEKFSQKQLAVFEYASQGMSVTDIAKQMNIGQGEVMLILSLKNEVE
jgi:DNA-binding NarL/FixJ family response regulator